MAINKAQSDHQGGKESKPLSQEFQSLNHQREWQRFMGDWKSHKRNFSLGVTLTMIATTNLDTSSHSLETGQH